MHPGRLTLLEFVGLGLLAAQPTRPLDAEIQQHLAAAREAEARKDYALAGAKYQSILRSRPNLAIVHQSLALTYHLRNKFSEAIPEFSRAVKLDSSLWGSYLFLGIDYYKTNQFESAIPALEKSVKLKATQAEPEARFWLGASHAACGRPAQAVRELRRAAELRPNDIEVLYELAGACDQQASALFQRIGQIEPRAAAVFLLQAEHFIAENRADLAKIEYQRAVLLRPDFETAIASLTPAAIAEPGEHPKVTEPDARATVELAQYWLSRGNKALASRLLIGLGKMEPADEGARRYINTARRAGPASQAGTANMWPQLFKARAAAESNHLQQAEELLTKLLRNDPRNLDVLLALGSTYKKWATLLLQQMVDIDPDSYRVHQLTAQQREEKGEYEQAIQSYQAALARQPELGGVRYLIGNAYFRMKQYDDAERWLSEELERNPHHALAHWRLGSLYTERAKPDLAIPHLHEALNSHPEWTDARCDFGRSLLLKGSYTESIIAFQRVAAEDPPNDRVHYFLSNAFRKLGRTAEAQSEMAKYQELNRERLSRVQQEVRDVSHAVEGK